MSGSLQLFYYDIGDDALRTFGDSDYEVWTVVAQADLPKLAFALLAEKYAGRADALTDFQAFSQAHDTPIGGGSWPDRGRLKRCARRLKLPRPSSPRL